MSTSHQSLTEQIAEYESTIAELRAKCEKMHQQEQEWQALVDRYRAENERLRVIIQSALLNLDSHAMGHPLVVQALSMQAGNIRAALTESERDAEADARAESE